MSLKRSAVNVLVWLAALTAGLACIVLAQSNAKKILLACLIMIALTSIVVLRKYMSSEQLLMPVLYLLIAATFANNAFFTIKLGFFSLFPYRILLILAGFIFIAEMLKGSRHLEKWNQVRVKGILMFFAFWFCYGMISLLWVKSVTDGIKYMFLLAMGMFFVFLIVMFFQKLDRIFAFYYIWLVMTVFVMGIGFYNHFTTTCRARPFTTGRTINSTIRHPFFSIKMTLRHFCPSAFAFIYLFSKTLKTAI